MIDADDLRLIREMADRLFAQHCDRATLTAAAEGHWPDRLWREVEGAGLTRALVGEARGGVGLPVYDGLGLIGIAAEYGAPIPFAETMIAAWLLDSAGVEVPAGPLTLLATERGARVPWGARTGLVCITAEDIFIAADRTILSSGANLAGEPRDDVVAIRGGGAAKTVPIGIDALEAIMAGVRAMQIAGALARITDLAAGYARERVQFGKPIARFQAIQHQLAVLATQAAAATAAADLARASIASGAFLPGCGIAKARTSEAAGIGAGIAHQVHGAIGFTLEHDLQFWTKRLWSWRDEYGAEPHWNAHYGRRLLAAGGDALWPGLTAI